MSGKALKSRLLLSLILLLVVLSGCQKKTVEYGGVSEPQEPRIEYTVEPDINVTPSK